MVSWFHSVTPLTFGRRRGLCEAVWIRVNLGRRHERSATMRIDVCGATEVRETMYGSGAAQQANWTLITRRRVQSRKLPTNVWLTNMVKHVLQSNERYGQACVTVKHMLWSSARYSLTNVMKLQCGAWRCFNVLEWMRVMVHYSALVHKNDGVWRHINVHEWGFIVHLDIHGSKEPLQLKHINRGFNVCNGRNWFYTVTSIMARVCTCVYKHVEGEEHNEQESVLCLPLWPCE